MNRLVSVVGFGLLVGTAAFAGSGPFDGLTLSPGPMLVDHVFQGSSPLLGRSITMESKDTKFAVLTPYCRISLDPGAGVCFRVAENATIVFENAYGDSKKNRSGATATVNGNQVPCGEWNANTPSEKSKRGTPATAKLTVVCSRGSATEKKFVYSTLYGVSSDYQGSYSTTAGAFRPLQTGSNQTTIGPAKTSTTPR
ncbi:MAG: hypothetical protein JST04_13195 [Bdellovibrionales bacterium]|nr:hypothetical protein [Bdellovibrionales bacterium]